jgi:GET complex subunit GET2
MRQHTCTTVRTPHCLYVSYAIDGSRCYTDPPLAALPKTTNLEQFVGEETLLPTPPVRSSNNSTRRASPSPFADFGIPSAGAGGPDPSIWSEEQQTRLLNALMAGAQNRSATQTPQPASAIEGSNDLPGMGGGANGALPEGDPFAALMAMMGPQGEQSGAAGPMGMMPQNLFAPPPSSVSSAPAQRTLLEKLMPVVHLVAGWVLLAVFVIWKEPQAYETKSRLADANVAQERWKRWAELGHSSPSDGWGVQFVVGAMNTLRKVCGANCFAVKPFFWAFTTLTLILHSWRIFKGLVCILSV